MQPVIIDVTTKNSHTVYRIHPDVLYGTVHKAVAAFMSGGNGQDDKLVALVRVAVKGVLLMYGDKILDSIFKSKNHPRPGKKDDLIEWYTDLFTKIGIAMWMKNETYLEGRITVCEVSHDHTECAVQIDTISTGPIASHTNALPASTNGTYSERESASAECDSYTA